MLSPEHGLVLDKRLRVSDPRAHVGERNLCAGVNRQHLLHRDAAVLLPVRSIIFRCFLPHEGFKIEYVRQLEANPCTSE